MSHNLAERSKLVGKTEFRILIGAPSHDPLTGYTSQLLLDLPDLGAPTDAQKFSRPLTYPQLVAQKRINVSDTLVMLVFSGHGSVAALEGPGAPPGALNHSNSYSAFYDDSSLNSGPEILLAFCCQAGRDLGDSYKVDPTKQVFVGFKTKIPFLLAEGVYAACWVEIIHGTASAMLESKDRRELRRSILALYDNKITYFHRGDGSDAEYALLMEMYLLKQKQTLRFIMK